MEISTIHAGSVLASAMTSGSPRSHQEQTESQQLIRAVKKLNETEFMGTNSEFTIAFDRDTHKPVIRLIDRETGELIRQIPPKYVLELAREATEQ